MTVARMGSISLDCADPGPLADFWADLLGGEVAFRSDEFVAVKVGPGWLSAVRIADYAPPTWPAGALPKQMHLDLAVDDLETAEAEAIRLGRDGRRCNRRPNVSGCYSTPPVTRSA